MHARRSAAPVEHRGDRNNRCKPIQTSFSRFQRVNLSYCWTLLEDIIGYCLTFIFAHYARCGCTLTRGFNGLVNLIKITLLLFQPNINFYEKNMSTEFRCKHCLRCASVEENPRWNKAKTSQRKKYQLEHCQKYKICKVLNPVDAWNRRFERQIIGVFF